MTSRYEAPAVCIGYAYLYYIFFLHVLLWPHFLFVETVVKCVCLNLLPFSFPESPGFRNVLSFLGRSSEGLSTRSVVIEMQALYTKMRGERLKDFIAAFDIKTGDDGKLTFEEEKHERICGETHDLFTSANGNMPMLALNIHYINRRHADG